SGIRSGRRYGLRQHPYWVWRRGFYLINTTLRRPGSVRADILERSGVTLRRCPLLGTRPNASRTSTSESPKLISSEPVQIMSTDLERGHGGIPQCEGGQSRFAIRRPVCRAKGAEII